MARARVPVHLRAALPLPAPPLGNPQQPRTGKQRAVARACTPSSQLDCASWIMTVVWTTDSTSTSAEKGSNARLKGWPVAQPTIVASGMASSPIWMDEPMAMPMLRGVGGGGDVWLRVGGARAVQILAPAHAHKESRKRCVRSRTHAHAAPRA